MHVSSESSAGQRQRLLGGHHAYEGFVDGRNVHLSLRDFEFLRFFVRSPNRVFTRKQILESVWGRTSTPTRGPLTYTSAACALASSATPASRS